jgi:hypothetical protein
MGKYYPADNWSHHEIGAGEHQMYSAGVAGQEGMPLDALDEKMRLTFRSR